MKPSSRNFRIPLIERGSFSFSKLLFSLLSAGLFAFALSGCHSNDSTPSSTTTLDSASDLTLKYATGFRVTAYQGAKLLEVTRPFQGATSGKSYLLVNRGSSVPEHDPSIPVILVPLKRVVCTSTTHIPMLDYLNETDKLVGFPTSDYISSEKTRARIDSGLVKDLGVDKGMDIEQIAALHPDVVIGYSIAGDFGQFSKIENLGIPVVIDAEYLEDHPLGRAEWIKFMGLFFNKEAMADSIFDSIEQQYKSVASLVDTLKSRPTVLSGIVYGDAWFLPGGKNNVSTLLHDAGCKYLWDDDPSTGFLQLSFESVYQRAHDADFWIGVGSYSTLEQLGGGDARYRRFDAFKNGNVFTYDSRKGATGGSEYLELGYLRPDILLEDLIRIAHPELLPGHELYFHARLK